MRFKPCWPDALYPRTTWWFELFAVEELVWNCPLSVCLRVGFLVSTYLSWIFGSMLILTNNQSSATLWVLSFYAMTRCSWEVLCNMNGQSGQKRTRERKDGTEACQLLNWMQNVIRSLREDVHMSHNIDKRVRMVVQSRRERMVGSWPHRYAFSAASVMMWLSAAPIDEFKVEPCLVAALIGGANGESTMNSYQPIPTWTRWFKEPTHVSPVVWHRSRSPQWRRTRRWQSAVRKGFINGTDVVSIATLSHWNHLQPSQHADKS